MDVLIMPSQLSGNRINQLRRPFTFLGKLIQKLIALNSTKRVVLNQV